MPDRIEPATSLSIARHTLQFILRTALESDSNPCCGLIGCCEPSTIDHAMPLSTTGMAEFGDFPQQDCDLQHMAAKWHSADVKPCGTFFKSERNKAPAAATLHRHETAVKKAFPELAQAPLIHLSLMLNTAGCLEAFAYAVDGDSVSQIPLLLKEDGQSSRKR